jgi:NAD(P)H-dependent FMN reductase
VRMIKDQAGTRPDRERERAANDRVRHSLFFRKSAMLKIAVIIGSTRPGRVGESVAKWVYALAKNRTDAEFELVDIQDFNLPLLDEPVPPSMGQYSQQHTKTWAAKIDSFDGYVFVTPEYNHGICGALKNAIDFVYREWNNKAAGFVGYGSAGGVRAVEHLRLVMAEVQVATVRNQVGLSLFSDFEKYTKFKPAAHHDKSLNQMLDPLIAWSGAMKTLRVSV